MKVHLIFKGDGAPAENEVECKENIQNTGDIYNAISSIYLRVEIDIVFIGLWILALGTRLYNLEEPKYIVLVSLHLI